MDQLLLSLQTIIAAVKVNSYFVAEIVGVLWLVHLVNWALHYQLNRFGVIPRTLRGIPGICFSPFLHADVGHLLFNSVPLFVLSNLVLLDGRETYCYASIIIIVLSGFGVWLFGKRAIHIGASSVIMGYFGYLMAHAYQELTTTTIILAILCVYYFSGLILMLLPGKKGISWEGHIFGFLAGIAAANASYITDLATQLV